MKLNSSCHDESLGFVLTLAATGKKVQVALYVKHNYDKLEF